MGSPQYTLKTRLLRGTGKKYKVLFTAELVSGSRLHPISRNKVHLLHKLKIRKEVEDRKMKVFVDEHIDADTKVIMRGTGFVVRDLRSTDQIREWGLVSEPAAMEATDEGDLGLEAQGPMRGGPSARI
ncbi:unnamed protein product [Darwinula stevensoni]|uniref:Uncharacterized protein n=1 Tax=Darwinula stevensoni TaxID=69355 RepID=A0A7R8XLA0_9CRUS|nr:unnamed protein product [Darwinula stevensoni]CAG0893995.1 unnamed protein product [Darwinula stevensoni]